MKRAVAAWMILVGVFVAPAVGDRVVLKDGRVLEGIVTESADKIVIEMPYGTISVAASEVERIERAPSPMELFEDRQAKVDGTDPDELAALAEWALEKGLTKQANQCLQAALDLDADHAPSRRLLGYVRADGKWLRAGQALQLAEARLEAGRVDYLLTELLPALGEIIEGTTLALRLKNVEAHALLRSRRFAEAQRGFESLASKSQQPASVRYRAIASILRDHPDGMYVLSEPYPALAALFDTPPAVKPGPASLARPEVLAGALRDRAKDAIRTGGASMEAGRKLELTEPEAAKAKYGQAAKAFDTADILVPAIARSYRVEITRRRIAMITRDMNVWAGRFDTIKAELAKRDLTPAAYANLILRMMRALKNVRGDLDAILTLAAPFDRELVLEITDATLRRARVDALWEVLAEELRELNGNR